MAAKRFRHELTESSMLLRLGESKMSTDSLNRCRLAPRERIRLVRLGSVGSGLKRLCERLSLSGSAFQRSCG
ncbi:hypothetical protein FF1_029479 [Malus domestica]